MKSGLQMVGLAAALAVPAGMTPKKVAYMRKSCVPGTLKNEAGIPLGPFRRDL